MKYFPDFKQNRKKIPKPLKSKKKVQNNNQVPIIVDSTPLEENEANLLKRKENEKLDIKLAINQLKSQAGSNNAYLPITLPFCEDQQKIINPSDEQKYLASEFINSSNTLNENELFLIQFPKFMPINKELQKKLKLEELDNEEPVYDTTGFLIKNDFENVFKTLQNNTHLGKLKIYKSGKVKMQIGENLFDMNYGMKTNFAQEISVVSKASKEIFILGSVRDRNLVMTHEFE